MKRSRAVSLMAVGSVAALLLSACSTVGGTNTSSTSSSTAAAPGTAGAGTESGTSAESGTSTGSSTPESSTVESSPSGPIADTITIGLEQPPGGYNSNTAAANSVYGAYVDNLTQGAFFRVQPDGTLKPDKEFGSYQKISDNPLTVKYTFADKAVWSDGVPIDFDDALLTWAALSGSYPSGQKDANGDESDLFTPASTNGWDQVKKLTGKAGDKSFTMVFTKPYVDWESLGGGFMPAHIVAQQAGLSPAGNGAELVDAITKDDKAKVAKIAKFWNEGWAYGEHLATVPKAELQPGSGPYKFSNAKDGALTIVKNDKWWGTPGKTNTFVFKEVSPEEWVQALANGDIDQYDPSNPTQDVVSQLKNLGDKAKYDVGEGLSFSHVDLDQSANGKFKDLRVRQAFAKCVPRQDIVDKFAAPVNPKAQILDLRETLPAQAGYAETLAKVPSAKQYDTVDLAGAKKLLTDAGVKVPYDIRFVRAKTSQLRADQIALIKTSCDKAGFNIIDTPQEDVFSTLPQSGKWDAGVFGWSASGLVASGESIYVTGGDQNYGKYSDKKVDSIWEQVVTSTDRAKAEALKAPMEEELWATVYNVVLYSTPNLAAWSSSVSGVVPNPTQYGSTWNAATWTKSAS